MVAKGEAVGTKCAHSGTARRPNFESTFEIKSSVVADFRADTNGGTIAPILRQALFRDSHERAHRDHSRRRGAHFGRCLWRAPTPCAKSRRRKIGRPRDQLFIERVFGGKLKMPTAQRDESAPCTARSSPRPISGLSKTASQRSSTKMYP